MFERGKLVTSLLCAAALVAGAVILTPFGTFADSAPAPAAITFTVTPGATPLLFEGGAAGVVVLTVENISPVPIQVVGVNAEITARGGLDSSDTLAGVPRATADTCRPAKGPIVLSNGDECWLGRGQAPYSLGSAYLFLPVSFGSASIAEP
jgi:hypothetical protein